MNNKEFIDSLRVPLSELWSDLATGGLPVMTKYDGEWLDTKDLMGENYSMVLTYDKLCDEYMLGGRLDRERVYLDLTKPAAFDLLVRRIAHEACPGDVFESFTYEDGQALFEFKEHSWIVWDRKTSYMGNREIVADGLAAVDGVVGTVDYGVFGYRLYRDVLAVAAIAKCMCKGNVEGAEK